MSAAAAPRIVVWSLAAWIGATLLGGRPARAELLEVRQVAAGMECPECARGLQMLVKRVPGVEAVETSWNRRMLTLKLRPGNHATLTQIRSIVLEQHFQVREAEIVVVGQVLLDPRGGASLFVRGSALTYRIDLGGQAGEDWRRSLAAAAGTEVVLTGRVPGAAIAEDPLVLWPLEMHAAPPRR